MNKYLERQTLVRRRRVPLRVREISSGVVRFILFARFYAVYPPCRIVAISYRLIASPKDVGKCHATRRGTCRRTISLLKPSTVYPCPAQREQLCIPPTESSTKAITYQDVNFPGRHSWKVFRKSSLAVIAPRFQFSLRSTELERAYKFTEITEEKEDRSDTGHCTRIEFLLFYRSVRIFLFAINLRRYVLRKWKGTLRNLNRRVEKTSKSIENCHFMNGPDLVLKNRDISWTKHRYLNEVSYWS